MNFGGQGHRIFQVTERDKETVQIFQQLQKKMAEVKQEKWKLGWGQRNALISHVYSDYTMHDELAEAVTKMEKATLHYNVLEWIFELMRKYRDLWGYFPEYA